MDLLVGGRCKMKWLPDCNQILKFKPKNLWRREVQAAATVRSARSIAAITGMVAGGSRRKFASAA
jgi:hypothetical protein